MSDNLSRKGAQPDEGLVLQRSSRYSHVCTWHLGGIRHCYTLSRVVQVKEVTSMKNKYVACS